MAIECMQSNMHPRGWWYGSSTPFSFIWYLIHIFRNFFLCDTCSHTSNNLFPHVCKCKWNLSAGMMLWQKQDSRCIALLSNSIKTPSQHAYTRFFSCPLDDFSMALRQLFITNSLTFQSCIHVYYAFLWSFLTPWCTALLYTYVFTRCHTTPNPAICNY